MKKIISLLLTVTIILSCVNIALAEEEATALLTNRQSEAYSVFASLGFINKDYDEAVVAEKSSVTRGEFASFIAPIFVNEINSETSYFHDVQPSYFASASINGLVGAGLISVSDERMFYPERNITQTEIAKMVLYAIGYKDMVEAYGGYPTGVDIISQRTGILNGINAKTEVSYADMLVIVYNALNTEMLEAVKYSTGMGNEYKAQGNTYFSKMLDIYTEKGVVYSTGKTSVDGNTTKEGKAVIGERTVNTNGINLSRYLGSNVKYIYKYDENNDEAKLIWLTVDNKVDTLTLNKRINNVTFNKDTYTLSYYDENSSKQQKANLKVSVNVIYNGRYVKNGNNEALSSDFYSIKLTDLTGDGYDTAVIEDYKNYVVSSVDILENVIYLKSKSDVDGKEIYSYIDLDNYKDYDIFDEIGNKSSISSVKNDNVLSVYEAFDNEYIKLVHSAKTEDAILTSYTDDGSYKLFNLGEKELISYKENMFFNLTAGSKYKFMLDANGLVANVIQLSDTIHYAFLINLQLKGTIGNEATVKMFDDSGKMSKTDLAKTIKIDNVTYKTYEKAYQALGGNAFQSMLIAYSLNNEGKINMILTPVSNFDNSGENKLVCVSDFASQYCENKTSKFGRKSRYNASTVVFGIPYSDPTNDKLYSVGTSSSLSNETYYTAAIYNFGTGYNEFASVYILKDKVVGVGNFVSTKVLVEKVGLTINDEGETVKYIEGYHGNTPIKLTFTQEATQNADVEALDCGDLFTVGSRIGEAVDSIEISYSPRTDIKPINNSFPIMARITSGYIHDVVGSTMMVGLQSGANFDEVYSVGATTIFIYDSKEKKLSKANPADLITYKNAGEKCDWMYIYTNSGDMRNLVVYR